MVSGRIIVNVDPAMEPSGALLELFDACWRGQGLSDRVRALQRVLKEIEA